MISGRVFTDSSSSWGPEIFTLMYAGQNEGLSLVDETVRLLSVHFAGFPLSDPLGPVGYINGGVIAADGYGRNLVKYCEPLDFEDGRAGQMCVLSGYWFPASEIVDTEFGPVGRPFAGSSPEDDRL